MVASKETLAISLLLLVIIPLAINLSQEAHAQVTINVNETTPCFLNYTAGVEMWDNCNFEEDYITAAVLPFEWVSGGYFSMIIVSVIIGMTYIKYHSAIYPLAIGIVFMPISYFLFPDTFVTWALIMAGLAVAMLLVYVTIRQTKEY